MLSSYGQALAKAQATASWAVGMCDNFVANMYGLTASGYTTAISHWNSIPSQYKHPGDGNPPAGALVFWSGGSNGFGHVAISDGKGYIYSTDMPHSGNVGHVPLSQISNQWGLKYQGWAEPYFGGQVVGTGTYAGNANQAQQVGAASGTTVPASYVGDSLVKALGVPSLGNALARGGIIALGAVLILIGLVRFTDTGAKVAAKVRSKRDA